MNYACFFENWLDKLKKGSKGINGNNGNKEINPKTP